MAHKTDHQPQRRLDTTTRQRARQAGVVAAIAAVLMSTTWSCQSFDLTVKVGSVSVTPVSTAGPAK